MTRHRPRPPDPAPSGSRALRRAAGALRAGLCALALPALAACAGTAPGSGAQAGECRIEQEAALPLAIVHGHLVLPVRINRTEARLVLDTGTERTTLTPEAVELWDLPRSRTAGTTLIGIGGQVTSQDAYAAIALGGVELARQVAVGPVPMPPDSGPPVAGLLGADLLSEYDVEISVPERRLRLYRTRGCSGGYAPWAGVWSGVPDVRTDGERLLVPVQIGTERLSAILDTGSDLSALPVDVAERLGVTRAEMAGDPQGTSRGVDLNRVPVRYHRFAEIRVGGERFAPARLAVAEMRLPRGDMLLGVDWMRARRVWLSYAAHRVFVQTLAALPRSARFARAAEAGPAARPAGGG